MKADFEKGTKICCRCRKELPLNMFNKDKSKNDELNIYCKECSRTLYRKWYRKDIEQSREREEKIIVTKGRTLSKEKGEFVVIVEC